MTGHWPNWTPAEDRKLKDLVESGASWEEIGRQLTRTALAVHARAKTFKLLGLRPKSSGLVGVGKWTADEDAELVRLATIGVSRAEIAVRLDRSVAGLEARARRLGVRIATSSPAKHRG
jgi:hypothetical protein